MASHENLIFFIFGPFCNWAKHNQFDVEGHLFQGLRVA
jgi:hypothetical protein